MSGSKKKSDFEVDSSSLADQMENSSGFDEDKKDDDPRSSSGLFASVSGQNVSSSSSAVRTSPESSWVASNLSDYHTKRKFRNDLRLHNKAIERCPDDAKLHYNRAVALICLRQLAAAVKEFQETIGLAPTYVEAHDHFGYLLLHLGQVENAREHLFFQGHKPDQATLQMLLAVAEHIKSCIDARSRRDWTATLKEAEEATRSGAESSAELFACQAEAHLNLHQLTDANLKIRNAWKYEPSAEACQSKIFGMRSEAYILFVQAQIDSSHGRFDNACTAIEKAGQIDPQSAEVTGLLKKMRLVGQARTLGDNFFRSGKYEDACNAYGDELSLDSSSLILYCNRATCWYKLGQWEKSLDDCNHALLIQPHYTKALYLKAASNVKLERWDDAVRDYEILGEKLPNDKQVAEKLSHAEVELKKLCREVGGKVELVLDLEKFRAAIMSSGVFVVLFEEASNLQCKQMSSDVDVLSTKYHSKIRFLKVDVKQSPAIAAAENITIVPTFKIYKNCVFVTEMSSPKPEKLEHLVKNIFYKGKV